MSASATCPLCETKSPWLANQRLLGTHDVDYFQCPACDLLFTEKPYWLDAAYSDAISKLDTGAIHRNEMSARLVLAVSVLAGFDADARGLDYGAGHGVLVRMLRDAGLDFRWTDKHAQNHYAIGFEGDARESYDLVTSFEVWEHFADVRHDLDVVFSGRPRFVLVGTVLHDGSHRPGWWYYLLDSGQHVSFFSERTMRFIAARYGYDALVGADHTLFVRRDVAVSQLRKRTLARVMRHATATSLLVSLIPAPVATRLAGYRSRMDADHARLKEHR